MKIRFKLTLWFTALVALIVGLAAIWGWLGLRASMMYQAEQEMQDKQQEVQLFIDTVAQEFKLRGLKFDLREHAHQLEQIFANDQTSRYDNIFIQITDLQGRVISRSSNLGTLYLPLQGFGEERRYQSLILKPDSGRQISILYASVPIQVGGVVRGSLQLGLSMVKSEGFLQQMLIFELLGLLFSIVLSLWLGQWLAQRALKPMQQITEQVRQMAGQDLFRPLDTQALSSDEIGRLAETFNALMLRISSVFQAQQRFLADASHEFKTPLTAIRGHAQLLRKRGAHHPEILEKSADTIIRETRRLSRLVEDLLLLARLEGHAEVLTVLDLRSLLLEIDEDLSPLYPQLQVQLPEHPQWIRGNADSLRRVFINLLDNAIKADPQGPIRLHVQVEPLWFVVVISDQGPGIAAEHLPHLFERFYRLEHDRNRQTGGSGIGLALVSEIVRFHRGQIQVESHLGQGTSFYLRFPRLIDQSFAKN